MTDRQVKNLPASIRQRLQQAAKQSGRPFQEVVQFYAMERFLYRLSLSAYADKFVLKGGLMLRIWGASATRPTRDIDLLGQMPNRIDDLVNVIRNICGQEVEPDALVFDPATVAGTIIKDGADYEGVRVTFRGSLQNIPLPMQIDIGFGDAVYPAATMLEFPTVLDHVAPKLRGYCRETVVAEKFEAMVKLGLLNSRMKDFYDLWLLSHQFDFDGAILAEAVRKTFSHRGTPLVPHPTVFSPTFASDTSKASQWRGFLRKSQLKDVPQDFASVAATIAAFLAPLLTAVSDGRSFNQFWEASGPWRRHSEA